MPIICHRGPLIHAFPALIHASAGNPIHSHLKSRAWLSSCMYKHASELHPILAGFSGANGKVSMTSNTRIERQRRRCFFCLRAGGYAMQLAVWSTLEPDREHCPSVSGMSVKP